MKKSKFHTRTLQYSFFGLVCLGLVLTSCDKGFDSLNIDETDINSIDPILVLNDEIRNTPGSGSSGFMLFDQHIVQHMVTPYGLTLAGGNFNVDNQFSWIATHWQYGPIRQLVDTIERTRGDDREHNVHQMARIFRAIIGLKLSDTMGDVPFSEAGYGVYEEILYPKYDSQEELYELALSEIQAATAALDASKRVPFDILYAGDIAMWKRFGNSLLVRYGMRLSEAAPSTAQQYVQAGFNGGVFQSNDDNAYILHDGGNSTFSLSGLFNGGERYAYYMTDVLVDYLQSTMDPRLEKLAVRYVGAASQGDQDAGMGKTKAAGDQVGMPVGHDVNTIDNQAAADGVGVHFAYTQADRDLMDQTASDYIITHAQTQLLLAEAAERGWINGVGADYFAAGVRANLEEMAQRNPSKADELAIPAGDITAFVEARRAAYLTGNRYEEIHNQYWVAGFLITPREVFANWRRTNYPTLQPNPYPDQEIDGDFIRRRKYPDREFDANTENIQAAISRQGWSGNMLDERVWWDTMTYNP